METVVCGMTQPIVEVVSQHGRCLKPTWRATRAHACLSAGTVAFDRTFDCIAMFAECTVQASFATKNTDTQFYIPFSLLRPVAL